MTEKYDVAVIGAGPGGYVCAIRLAQFNKKVVLIEKEQLGGECLNFGCIPTKALLRAGNILQSLKTVSRLGIDIQNYTVDYTKLNAWKERIVARLQNGIEQICNSHGIKIIYGTASFRDEHHLAVNENYEIEFDYAVIATGSKPKKLSECVVDNNKIITSKEAITNLHSAQRDFLVAGGPENHTARRNPHSDFIIIGAGAIGLELGLIYIYFGYKVKIIEIMNQILPGFDKEVANYIEERIFRRKGAEIYLNSKIISTKKTDNNIEITIEQNGDLKNITGSKVLVAVGREADPNELNLEKANVQILQNGFIKTDEYLRTTQPNIYAIGDVRGPPLLAYKASMDAVIVAQNITGEKLMANYKLIPKIVFTEPEIAVVGLSEEDCIQKKIEYKVSKLLLSALGRANIDDSLDGFIKIVIEKNTDTLLGVHIIAPHAS